MKNQKLISRNAIIKFKPGGDTKSLLKEFPIERGINGEYYIVHTPENNHATFSDIISKVSEIPDILLGNDYESKIQTRMKRDGLTRALAELIEDNILTGVAPIAGRSGGYRTVPIKLNTRAFLASRRPVTTTTVRPTGASPKTVTTTRNYVGEAELAAKMNIERLAERWLNLRNPLSRMRTTTYAHRGVGERSKVAEGSLDFKPSLKSRFKDYKNTYRSKLKKLDRDEEKRINDYFDGKNTPTPYIIKGINIANDLSAGLITYYLLNKENQDSTQNLNIITNNNLSPWSNNINTNTSLSPWSKTKNSNVKLSPWSTNLNNQLTQRNINLSNNSLNNVRTSGNILSLQRSNGSVKNFRDSVIDYQNSHSTDNDIKFTIPSGNVPIIENDSLIRETIPDVETMMPTNLISSVKRNPTLLITSSSIEHRLPSNSTEYRLPSSLAEYRSKNPILSSNSSDVTTTPKQKEDIAITLNEMISEILGYLASGNKIEGIEKLEDINKLEPLQILDIFRLIQRVYANEGTTPKEYESGYEPKKEEKKQLQTSTSPFAETTPTSVDLNRADVRAIMSHYGLDTTPSLRKAFRKYLGGDRNQDISFIDLNSNLHRDWIAPFVVFKKAGGRLISKNPIQRFKNI